MVKLINHFNGWYDQLQEPWRFLLFISYMALAVFPLQLGLQFGNVLATLFGLVLFAAAVIVGVFRAFGLGGKHRWVGYAIGYVMIGLFAMIALSIAL